MRLTDLDIDCIEEILEYLEFKDILSAADSNNRLRHASKFLFIRKHSNRIFRLYSRHACIDLVKIGVYGAMMVKNPKYIFQTLRIFGHLISSLDLFLECRALLPDYVNINRYINEFCTETLEYFKINIWAVDLEDALDCLESPFTRVKTVHIDVNLGGSAQKNFLVRIFPKMEQLSLRTSCSKFIHNECIANHFPHLKIFKIMSRYPHKEDYECSEVYRKFIRLNPQLQHLKCFKVADDVEDFIGAHESQVPIHCHQPNII